MTRKRTDLHRLSQSTIEKRNQVALHVCGYLYRLFRSAKNRIRDLDTRSGRRKTESETLTLVPTGEKLNPRPSHSFRPPKNRKRDLDTGSSHLYRGKIRSRERSGWQKIKNDTPACVPAVRALDPDALAPEKSVLESVPTGGKSRMTLLRLFHPSEH